MRGLTVRAVTVAAAAALVLTVQGGGRVVAGAPGQELFSSMLCVQRSPDSACYNGAAQTLTAELSGSLDWVELPLSRAEFTSESLVVEIHASTPDGALLASSEQVAATSIPVGNIDGSRDTWAWVHFTLADPISVAAGDALAIVIPVVPVSSSMDPAWGWGMASGDMYAGGGAHAGIGPTSFPPDGRWDPWWDGTDLAFRTPISDIELPPPAVSLTVGPVDPSTYDEVTFSLGFHDPAGRPIDHGTIDFGDGTSTNVLTDIAHTYAADGEYEVAASVTTTDGRTANALTTVSVRTSGTPTQPANDDFARAVAIADGASVSIDLRLATVEPGEPTGSCVTVASRTVWFRYDATRATLMQTMVIGDRGRGAWVVWSGESLDALTEVGCATDWTVNVFVEPGRVYYIQVAPGTAAATQSTLTLTERDVQASFDFWPHEPLAGTEVQLYDMTWDPIGVQAWAWDFGDGSTASDPWVSHTYATTGDYEVQLTVTTADGRTYSTRQTVAVRQPDLSPTFDVWPNAPWVGDWVTFLDTTWDEIGVQSVSWDFGDGGSSSGSWTSHRFTAAGEYVVVLSVTTFDGRSASARRTVTVRADADPPALYGTGPLSYDADSPRGAAVTYSPWAYDAISGSVPVVCDHASGSMFPIGDTLVVCTATDGAGNVGSAAFTVTVRSAPAQLASLRADVATAGKTGASLVDKLRAAERLLADAKTAQARDKVAAFANEVRSQAGKAFPAWQATAWLTAAARILAVLGG